MNLNQIIRGISILLCFILQGQALAQSSSELDQYPKDKVSEYQLLEDRQRVINAGSQKPEILLPPPSNDNCGSAINLTVGANCVSGTTNAASIQAGEYLCISPGGGISPETVWYRFTATNDSLVIGFIQTNSTNCATVFAAYGPFAPGGGCLPAAGNQLVCQNMGLIDPGFHPLLTGLTIGQDYLIQVQGNNCGGPGSRFSNFCLEVNNPAPNAFSSTAATINNCGVAFLGSTAGGHWGNGTSIGANNLDNNVGTSIAGASEVGDDVTFVINNISWFTFCNGNTTSCDWSLVLNGISGCRLSAPNAGVQAAVFTGSPAALTNLAISPSIIPQGGSWASGNFTVGAGQCAYIAVDGFAGDECNYNLTLTNASCPCALLPIEMAYMTGKNYNDKVLLNWEMNNQEGLSHFELERGTDPSSFNFLSKIAAKQDNHASYTFSDPNAVTGWNYYRLKSVSLDGSSHVLGNVNVLRKQGNQNTLNISQTKNELQLYLQATQSGQSRVQILDLQGKSVFLTNATVEEGRNLLTYNIDNLSPGVYMLKLGNDNYEIVKKFIRI